MPIILAVIATAVLSLFAPTHSHRPMQAVFTPPGLEQKQPAPVIETTVSK